jgi:hypothetical protein
MTACLKTAGLLGTALPMLAAMMAVTPAEAQSSAREWDTNQDKCDRMCFLAILILEET